MSSLARPTRILRGAPAAPASSAAAAEDEVFVVAGSVARALGLPGPVASAASIIAAAEAQAAGLLEAARSEAALLVTAARAEAAATREAARSEGFASGLANGRASATSEAADLLDLIRSAAAGGQAVRDQLAASADAVITEAVLMAVRRVVGDAYRADPGLTAAACADAVRAASGQQIVSIRVNPDVEGAVTAALVDVAAYVRPDEAVAVGGCLVDLRDGSIDATLDTRLSLMELAVRDAAGTGAP